MGNLLYKTIVYVDNIRWIYPHIIFVSFNFGIIVDDFSRAESQETRFLIQVYTCVYHLNDSYRCFHNSFKPTKISFISATLLNKWTQSNGLRISGIKKCRNSYIRQMITIICLKGLAISMLELLE